LRLSEHDFWSLTFGQFYKLCDRHAIQVYISRYDVTALHASFINANSKSKTSVRALLDKPSLSDAEDKMSKDDMLSAFKQIFPEKKGEISKKAKRKVERYLKEKK
jgi:hypothetical protein